MKHRINFRMVAMIIGLLFLGISAKPLFLIGREPFFTGMIGIFQLLLGALAKRKIQI